MTQPVRETKPCPKCGKMSYVYVHGKYECYLCGFKEKEVEDETN